jgi:hypothetical protein
MGITFMPLVLKQGVEFGLGLHQRHGVDFEPLHAQACAAEFPVANVRRDGERAFAAGEALSEDLGQAREINQFAPLRVVEVKQAEEVHDILGKIAEHGARFPAKLAVVHGLAGGAVDDAEVVHHRPAAGGIEPPVEPGDAVADGVGHPARRAARQELRDAKRPVFHSIKSKTARAMSNEA